MEYTDRVFPQAGPPTQHKLEQGKAGDGVWLGLGNAIAFSVGALLNLALLRV